MAKGKWQVPGGRLSASTPIAPAFGIDSALRLLLRIALFQALVGFNLMDSEIQISCEILDIEGRLKLFPNFQGSKISVLIFRPNPKIHFTIGGDCSALNIKGSFIDKLRLQELCVGAPAEIIGRIFKSYKRSDNQELLILEDGSVIGSLDIHEVELHGPNTTIGIHADASSKILSIEIADNTKIKNRFVATEKS